MPRKKNGAFFYLYNNRVTSFLWPFAHVHGTGGLHDQAEAHALEHAEDDQLPGAFRHPEQGFVDALVMYKDLT